MADTKETNLDRYDSMGAWVAILLILAIALIIAAFFGPSLMLMR